MTTAAPSLLTDTKESIQSQMNSDHRALFPGLSSAVGTMLGIAYAAMATEMGRHILRLNATINRAFARTAVGADLDQKAGERNVVRLQPTASVVTLHFTGTAGATIPAGTQVTTAGLPGRRVGRVFATNALAVVGSGGAIDVPATATATGADGNIPANGVIGVVTAVAGVSGVSNPAPATGGTDLETDADLRDRFFQVVQNPGSSGNGADYINWAIAVSGVGGASVSGPTQGNPPVAQGNVRLSLVGTDSLPATLAVRDAVLTRIAGPYRLGPYEAETFTLSGSGVSIDATQTDDVGNALLFVYNAAGQGQATQPNIQTLLPERGVYTALVRLKSDLVSGTVAFFRIGVWNNTTGTWAQLSPSAANGTASRDYAANQMTVAFGALAHDLDWQGVDFYYDGASSYELRLIRLTADTVTRVWIDQVDYRSAFSAPTTGALIPVGSRLEVRAAIPVTINVAVTGLVYQSGADPTSVTAAARAAVIAYINSVATARSTSIQIARVGVAILSTPGVLDYNGLTINSGVVNVPITYEQVPLPGTIL
jgi:uncharacterized phage protein gp47/JayE